MMNVAAYRGKFQVSPWRKASDGRACKRKCQDYNARNGEDGNTGIISASGAGLRGFILQHTYSLISLGVLCLSGAGRNPVTVYYHISPSKYVIAFDHWQCPRSIQLLYSLLPKNCRFLPLDTGPRRKDEGGSVWLGEAGMTALFTFCIFSP